MAKGPSVFPEFDGWKHIAPDEPIKPDDKLICIHGFYIETLGRPDQVEPLEKTGPKIGRSWSELVDEGDLNPAFYPYRKGPRKLPGNMIYSRPLTLP